MRRAWSLLIVLAVSAMPMGSSAQAPTGKTLDIYGCFDNLAVNDAGSWIVQVDTNNIDTTIDACLVQDGALLLRENDPLPPAPATISSFDTISIGGTGTFGGNIFLRNMPSSQDSGVYLGSNLIVHESQVSTAPQFSPGTPSWLLRRQGQRRDQFLLVASVDDPFIASTVDRALVLPPPAVP
jgi:hypothetical protein